MYLAFNLSFMVSIVFLDFAPVAGCVGVDVFSRFFGSVGELGFGPRCLIQTSSSDHR